MQDQLNEKLSQFLDDELDSEQALALLKSVRGDELLKDKLRRYQIVSQVLKSNEYSPVPRDFADKIHERIRQEPVYFLPQKKAGFNWRKVAFAVAASLALAVVWLSAKVDRQQRNPFGSVEIVASGQMPPNVLNARFNEYLQAHDNGLYVNNNLQRTQPYARVVGYSQD